MPTLNGSEAMFSTSLTEVLRTQAVELYAYSRIQRASSSPCVHIHDFDRIGF